MTSIKSVKQTSVTILLLLLPIGTQLAWQLVNNGLPVSDAGSQYRIAYLTYLAFAKRLHNGLYFLFHSGGRPVLFTAFIAPFFFLAEYNILLPYRSISHAHSIHYHSRILLVICSED